MSATYIGSAWSCTVRLVVEDATVLTAATADLLTLLERVDLLASRFRVDSTLSVANERAGKPTPIPALLVDLVAAALDAAADTAGAVDPTLGLAMHRIGYDRDIDELRSSDAGNDAAALRAGSTSSVTPPPTGTSSGRWRSVRLHREVGLLTVPRNTALDLGATAKAWTADHAARTLADRYRTGVLVELGGDLAVAGWRDGGWCIEVAEREGDSDQQATQKVQVTHGGVATSTTTVRAWTHDGVAVHHIIDPRTGLPADGPWRTVTVHAASALAANVASTASIVKGDAALEWLTRNAVAARLVSHDGTVVTTAGWPNPDVVADTRDGSATAARDGSSPATRSLAVAS